MLKLLPWLAGVGVSRPLPTRVAMDLIMSLMQPFINLNLLQFSFNTSEDQPCVNSELYHIETVVY